MITIAAIDASQWELWRSLRLEALREAPEAFSSTLAEWSGTGDTEGRWRERLATVPYNVVAYLDGKPVGIASSTAPEDGTVDLISLWVDPTARGLGAGVALVGAVTTWARSVGGALRVQLAVRTTNERAILLYVRNGFVFTGTVANADESFPEIRMVLQVY